MEWVGLVGHVEQDLERTISQDLLPKDGFLPSENRLAKYYGVSRTTVREALRRLAARDLVVQHPGRRSRAVALDEAVTLESLSVLFNGAGPIPPERLRLLEGYLALKRDTAVELLVSCCEHASARALSELERICFSLMDSAHWEPDPGRWVTLEFDLLRLAASAANRPGLALLLQSLERSYRAMARHLLPHVDAKSIRKWALCAFQSLGERDIPRLRQELPVLLKASDELLLKGLSPSHEPTETPLPSRPAGEPLPLRATAPEATHDEPAEAQESDPSASSTVLSPVSSASDDAALDQHAQRSESALASPVSGDPTALEQFAPSNGTRPSSPETETHSVLGQPAPGDASEVSSPATAAHATLGPPDQGGGAGPISPNLSACRTGSREVQPPGSPPPPSRAAGSRHPLSSTAPEGQCEPWPPSPQPDVPES